MFYDINQNLAKQIVDAAKQTVDKNINFINKLGIVIATTDNSRLDTFHEAGLKAVKTSSIITVGDNTTYEGSKIGVNYPIIIDGQTIGAIGISGTPQSVSKYGFLILKLTEIFIKEDRLMFENKSKTQKIDYLIKLLLNQTFESIAVINQQLNALNISADNDVFILIIEINKQLFKSTTTKNSIHNIDAKIVNFFTNQKIDLFSYEYPNRYICIINSSLFEKIKSRFMYTFKDYSSSIYSGVSEISSINTLKTAYSHALLALNHSIKVNSIFTESKNIMLNIILSDITPKNRENYINEILIHLTSDEISLLKTYYKNDLSLLQTATELFIHKNTVQYKLEKIYEKTNLNPRKYEDSIKLYIALLLK